MIDVEEFARGILEAKDHKAIPILADMLEDKGSHLADEVRKQIAHVGSEKWFDQGWLLRVLADIPDRIGLLEELDTSDWEEAFKYADKPDIEPPGASVDGSGFTRKDVAEVIAANVEYGDYAETSCVGVFRLKDGRYACLTASCDTTGWD